MNPYESGAIIDMNAARKTVPTPVDADASIEQCTLGVGDGTGSLFVHGSYEAIKRVQAIIHENERMRRTNAAAKAGAAWMPEAAPPAPCMKVIATYVNSLGNRRTIMAKWIPGKTEEAHSLDDEFGEYDEATDTTYVPEGWYEVIDNFDDCTFVAVSEGVITHWMPLPEAPDAIRAGAKEHGE